MLHLFAGAFVLVLVFVSIVGNLILQLKYKVQMSWKTEVNYGLSLPVILKEIPPSSQIFVGMLVHSQEMTSLIAQNGSKTVDLALTAVTAIGVCFIVRKMVMVITTSYV